MQVIQAHSLTCIFGITTNSVFWRVYESLSHASARVDIEQQTVKVIDNRR
jgi:hypothetical protein